MHSLCPRPPSGTKLIDVLICTEANPITMQLVSGYQHPVLRHNGHRQEYTKHSLITFLVSCAVRAHICDKEKRMFVIIYLKKLWKQFCQYFDSCITSDKRWQI